MATELCRRIFNTRNLVKLFSLFQKSFSTNTIKGGVMNQHTEFWLELDRFRADDPTTKTGRESDRSFARRIQCSSKLLTEYRRGMLPQPDTVKKICRNLGLSETQYLKFLALIGRAPLDGIVARPLPLVRMPVRVSFDNEIVTRPSGSIGIDTDTLEKINVSEHLVAIELKPGDESLSPSYPPGAILVIDLAKGREQFSFEPGRMYAVRRAAKDGELQFRWLSRINGEVWMLENSAEIRPERAWTDELGRLVVGMVVWSFLVPPKVEFGRAKGAKKKGE